MKLRFALPGLLAIAADAWGGEFAPVAPSLLFETAGDFAVVQIDGPLMQRVSGCWDSYDSIAARVEEACKSDRPAILLKLSSPGGQVSGCFELSAWIRDRARVSGKKVVAYVDGLAASAAYALACAADRIVVPPTGIVGSIGCIQVACDETARDRAMGLAFEMIASGARKVDGNPHVAMSDDARAAIQAGVNDMATTFFATVAAARGMTPADVAKLEAGVFVGAKAVAARLADEVMTLAELVASGAEQTNGQAAEEKTMTKTEAAKAAAKALSESDDEKEAAMGKKMLAAFEESDEKKDDDKDEKKEDAKAESDDDSEKKDEKKDDAEAKAAAASSNVISMIDARIAVAAKAAKVQDDEKAERATLMASRPDFPAELVSALSKSPLVAVREAVKAPRFVAPKSQVADARAAIGVASSVSASTNSNGDQLPEDEAHKLDVQMGIRRETQAFRHDGVRSFIAVMTPAEARAEVVRRDAEKKGSVTR